MVYDFSDDELVDIVNEHDEVVGMMWRSLASAQRIMYRRIVLAFLVDDQKRLCFLRRAASKRQHPNNWGLVGGCVQSGESYEAAFKREVQEEILLDVSSCAYRNLGILSPKESLPYHYFKGVYEITIKPEQVQCNPDDFSEIVWLSPKDLKKIIQSDALLMPDLLDLINHFYPAHLSE